MKKIFVRLLSWEIPMILALILVLGKLIPVGQALFCYAKTAFSLQKIVSCVIYCEEIAKQSPYGWTESIKELYDSAQAERKDLISSENPNVSSFASSDHKAKMVIEKIFEFFLLSYVLVFMTRRELRSFKFFYKDFMRSVN